MKKHDLIKILDDENRYELLQEIFKIYQPLNVNEIIHYRTLMDRLKSFPESIRYFNEIHEESLNILANRGCKHGFLIYHSMYGYVNTSNQTGLILDYNNRVYMDHLKIYLLNGENIESFHLDRQLGHLTKQLVNDLDLDRRISRGITHLQLLKGLFQLEPSFLYVEELIARNEIKEKIFHPYKVTSV